MIQNKKYSDYPITPHPPLPLKGEGKPAGRQAVGRGGGDVIQVYAFVLLTLSRISFL